MRAFPLFFSLLFVADLFPQVCWEKSELDAIAAREAHAHSIGSAKSSAPDRNYDIHYQRFDLHVDPAVRWIEGSITHHFTALEDLDQLIFDLSDTLTVSSILFQGEAIGFTQQSDSLIIPIALAANATDSITIAYSGVPPGTGFGSFVQTEHEGVPVIWTLSEPYGAKDWWPCKQDLQDKADSIDLFITTPEAYRAVSNGLLVEELGSEAGTIRFHWRHRYPIAFYLIAFAVTNYEVYHTSIELPGDITIPMETWAYPENAEEMQINAADIQQQMPLFSELFGLYPFANEKYGHAQFGWGGGMEHQTMTFMGGWSYELAAHELAHQWFGDKVTCGSWEDIWLNEGFASYLSGLCYDFLGPQYWHIWKEAQINDIVSLPDGSVHCTDTTDISRLFSARLTYRKGAFILHMLRWIMGDDAFFQGCRDYFDDPDLAYSSARTSDLQEHLENSSGMDLDWFFADWYYGEGHPMYEVNWMQDDDGTVTVTIDQEPSHPSVDFFQLPVPIRFSDGVNDTIVVFDHTFSGEEFTFDLPFEATTATFDPDLWLISGQNVIVQMPESGSISDRPIVFPNPAQEVLNVAIGSEWNGTIAIFDGSGRLVKEEALNAQGTLAIPIGALAAGSYVIELRTEEMVYRSQFVKH